MERKQPSAPLRRGKVPQKIYWEGNILNKISKKIVALATMAAFVLTLVPVAAFAAETDPVASLSSYTVSQTDKAGEMKVKIELEAKEGQSVAVNNTYVKLIIKDSEGQEVDTTDHGTLSISGTESPAIADVLGTGDELSSETTLEWTISGFTSYEDYTVEAQVKSDAESFAAIPVSGSNIVYVPGPADYQTSYFNIMQNNAAKTEVTTTVGTELTGQFFINDTNGKVTPADLANATNTYVWAIDQKTTQTTSALTVAKVTDDVQVGTKAAANYYPLAAAAANNGEQLKISFNRSGDYVLYVGTTVAPTLNGAADTTQVLVKPVTIHVEDKASYVTGYTVAGATDVSSSSATVDYTGTPNGVAAGATVNVTVNGQYNAGGAAVMANKTVDITAGSQLNIVDAEGNALTQATTDNNGQFSFNVIAESGTPAGLYPVTLSCDGKTFKVNVKVTATEDTTPKTIETVDTGKTLTDTNVANLKNVAQFVVKNAAGEVITPTLNDSSSNAYTYSIRTIKAPTDFKGTFSLKTTANTDKAYELQANSLVPGEYTVRVALNGDSADVSFTVDRFGEAVSSKIVITETGSTKAVTNVYAGKKYTGTVYLVDENGLEQVADYANMTIGILKGSDAVTNFTANPVDGTFNFDAVDDQIPQHNDNALIGTDIEFIAFYPTGDVNATATVTVADPANIEGVSLAFDKESGEAAKYNTVNVSVVNADGDVVDVDSNDVSVAVISQSDEDATISADMGDVENGKGELTLYSDKETTADVLVVVETTKDSKPIVYAGTLTYAFGEQDIPVDTTVVMTIGSADFVVNNEVVTKEDSAPYIANDRTYVPFRALGEALGAEVNWDNDARTVTYTLGNTEVVLTIDETTYTVNGEEKTMDVAPVITGDRTYVPVRFVGEALGFKVVALSAADGTTASVVFQK